MDLIMEVIRDIRATRSEYRVDAGRFIPATVAAGCELPTLRGAFDMISRLARVQPLTVYETLPDKPRDAVGLIVGDATVYLPLSEMTDVDAERERLARELDNARSALQATDRKLANENFVTRAPDEVVARERERAHSLTDLIRRLEERRDLLGT
jgi:valyl-tRNA synthetase